MIFLSFSTLIIINKPKTKRISKDAMPNLGDENIKVIVPKRTGPIKDVTLPANE